ncbi:hypothetical protein ACJIZ3_013955 [Penstemon smallii]|uniref:Uncharacterized protein n=1 Tax=Penstemon smallii TaxID=265156 RepID=A0ABD3RI61_9LAMI
MYISIMHFTTLGSPLVFLLHEDVRIVGNLSMFPYQ